MLSKRTKSTRDGVKRGITVGESFVLTDGQPVWVTDGKSSCDFRLSQIFIERNIQLRKK